MKIPLRDVRLVRGCGGTAPEGAAAARPPPLLQIWPSNGQDSPVHDESPAAAHYDSNIESVRATVRTVLLHPNRARSSTPDRDSASATSSPSPAASLNSVAVAGHSDPDSDLWDRRRRSSTLTARYSLLDALDLEYALLRAAARGSVGPHSISLRSDSVHKLTFTQSLAFPALATRVSGLAGKRGSRRRPSPGSRCRRQLDPHGDSGLNAFAKIVTALVLVLVSVMVFAVVYKFVCT